jgi:hypothetical protein
MSEMGAEVLTFPGVYQEVDEEQQLAMAAGAETVAFYHVPGLAPVVELRVVPETVPTIPEGLCTTAESDAGAYAVRERARAEALAEMAQNKKHKEAREYDMVPIAIDALGSARKAAEYKVGTPEYESLFTGLVDDCDRLLAEVRRKNGWELFPPVIMQFSPETGELYAYGYPMRKTLKGGLSPFIAYEEEEDRRVNDVVENATDEHEMAHGEYDRAYKLSMCANWAIEKYEKGGTGLGGYVPPIEKFMIQGRRFDREKNQLIKWQLAIPGKLFTEKMVSRLLERIGAAEEGQELSKTQIHDTYILAHSQDIPDEIAFAKMLDDMAMEEHGYPVFLGERVTSEADRRYEDIPAEAMAREAERETQKYELADFVMGLYRKGIDARMAELIVMEHVDEMIKEEVSGDPELAAMIYDKRTADGIQKALDLDAEGRTKEAAEVRMRTLADAPDLEVCDGGVGDTCGLERVDRSTAEGKALAERLKAEPGDTIIIDKVRRCENPQCGARALAYAFNAKKVNKLCQNCGAFESKKTG